MFCDLVQGLIFDIIQRNMDDKSFAISLMISHLQYNKEHNIEYILSKSNVGHHSKSFLDSFKLNQIDSIRVDFFELEPELPEILDGA